MLSINEYNNCPSKVEKKKIENKKSRNLIRPTTILVKQYHHQ